MGDITGVATISRADYRAQQGRPFVSAPALATPLDGEVVESDAESGPENGSYSLGDAMPYPEADGDGGGDIPRSSGLMTLEALPKPDAATATEGSQRSTKASSRPIDRCANDVA